MTNAAPSMPSVPPHNRTRDRTIRFHNRTIRRTLATIHPLTCSPQLQSPLFALLPAELRTLIFSLALSQTTDSFRLLQPDMTRMDCIVRPFHEYHTTVSTALLSTCRLIYFETKDMAMRSFTHHFRIRGWSYPTWMRQADLRHMSRVKGRELYHLHEYLQGCDRQGFESVLFRQCRWKRLSWTVGTYVWDTEERVRGEMGKLIETLRGLEVPESCEEVMLELETRVGQVCRWEELVEVAKVCKDIEIKRRDARRLPFDEELSVEYSWKGRVENDEAKERWDLVEGDVDVEHRTMRMCWRTRRRRREYLRHDLLDCMSLDGPRIEEVKPLGCVT